MLAFPTKGMAWSVKVHNVTLDVLCDWLEGTMLFSEDELSKSDVTDALCEEHYYDSQDFASQIVSDAWTQLRRRQDLVRDAAPFDVGSSRIKRVREWKEVPGHSFCVLLSWAKWLDKWARQFGSDYTEQGELFEEFTKESLEHQFDGWRFHITGWSRTRANRLTTVVNTVAELLNESRGNVTRWTNADAKEAGLDVLCYRPFPDGRVGVPVYLMQCASGGNWEGKLHTPNLDVWTKLVVFAARPRKAFSTPFAFLDKAFISHCGVVNGMLLDRYRLLAPGRENLAWESRGLRDRIISWAAPRVKTLPTREG